MTASQVAGLAGDFDRDPAYRGLAETIRILITDGRIPAGVRLPSERDLTTALGVSRTTVSRAYATLRDHGFLASRQGSGSVTTLPASSGVRSDHLLPPGMLPAGKIDLTCAAPTPAPGLVAAYRRASEQLPAYLSSTGYYPSGLPVLREAVARWYDERGLPTDPEQVMIVPGALAGVAIATRALVRRGSRTLLESPTYPNAIATLRHSGARPVSADVGREGAHLEPLLETVRQVRPGLAYLIPDFHNPTGHLMSDPGRERLAATLRTAGTTAIVDESLVDTALDGQAMPAPFATHHPDTISVGSMSKSHWGGLRVGWLRAPHPHVEALFRARLSLDLGVPVLEQLVAADLLARGGEDLEHRRAQLRASRDATLAAIGRHLPSWRVSSPGGGMTLWCELPLDGAGSSALAVRAERFDVLLAAGPNFAPEGGLDRFLRIPFSHPAPILTEAVAGIAAAWAANEPLAAPRRQRTSSLVA